MKVVVIKKNDENQRLDKFLLKSFPNLPQALMYKYIRKKRIKINNKRCEASCKLSLGDVLYLYINDELLESNPDTIFLNSSDSLDVVFEDQNIILVNKPIGVLVHEDESEKTDTLINRIKKYLYQKKEFDPQNEQSFVPALVNRIDRNTQGIVIGAKNAEALRILNQKLKDREIKKHYLCLVHGSFESQMKKQENILRHFLVKNEKENRVFIYDNPVSNSKTILTKFKVLENNINNKNVSLLEVELLTGRTHQIRAHMAYVGHPLVGDTKYGTVKINQNYNTKYQVLISNRILFDFQTESGILSYLNKKSFSLNISPKDIYKNIAK